MLQRVLRIERQLEVLSRAPKSWREGLRCTCDWMRCFRRMRLAGPHACWLNPGEESDPIIPKVPSQVAGHFPFGTLTSPLVAPGPQGEMLSVVWSSPYQALVSGLGQMVGPEAGLCSLQRPPLGMRLEATMTSSGCSLRDPGARCGNYDLCCSSFLLAQLLWAGAVGAPEYAPWLRWVEFPAAPPLLSPLVS